VFAFSWNVIPIQVHSFPDRKFLDLSIVVPPPLLASELFILDPVHVELSWTKHAFPGLFLNGRLCLGVTLVLLFGRSVSC